MWWFAAGVVAAGLAGLAWPVPGWLCLPLAGLALLYRRSSWRVVPLLFGLGLCWATSSIYQAQRSWLPESLSGEVLELRGRIAGLPESEPLGDSLRWRLELEQVHLSAHPERWPGRHRIRLSAWGFDGPFHSGDQVTARVRLQRPRGWVNQGSVDRARHDFANGIHARGSLRELIHREPDPDHLDALRADLSAQARARLVEHPLAAALIPALLAGDRRAMASAHWTRLQRTGTAHLISISGLHITLVSGLVWWLARWLSGPLWSRRGFSAQQLATVPALLAAVVYSALAGFALPTVRALIMTSVALCAVALRSRPALTDALGAALAMVLIFDPLAVLNNGFWLSFVAVAVLLVLAVSGHGLLRMQIVLSLGLGALAGWLFVHWGLASPIANLCMVPLFTLLVIPLVLVGGLLPGAESLLIPAAWLVEYAWQALGWLETVNYQLPPPASALVVALLVPAALMAVLPSLPLPRWLPLFLLLPWLYPDIGSPDNGEFDLVIFDVGQGQATALRTRNHLILYDLGPGWPGGNAGRSVIEPWLRRYRLSPTLVFVSHGDLDHGGGFAGLKHQLDGAAVYSGEPARVPGSRACRRGQSWRFDDVTLEVLWPAPGITPPSSNDASCVVLIKGDAGSALLAGDITHPVEYWLSARHQGPVDVLQVPHHGSRSSNSYTFLRAMRPRIGIVSAGYGNRFGHPAEETRRRFDALGIPLLVTAETGMIVFPLRDQDNAGPVLWRERYPRVWRPPADRQ